MKYRNDKGTEYEISYSQKLQQDIVKELKRSQKLQKTSIKATIAMIALLAVILIIMIFVFIYLDQRNVITNLGRLLFC